MKIIRSSVLGFCTGVRRAVNAAAGESERLKTSGGQVFILGPLVHNPGVQEEIKKNGIKELLHPPENPENSTLIIRAHGIEPLVEKELRNKGVRIVDATCYKVKDSQLKAEELARAGYSVFLAGEQKHAEIRGIFGYVALGADSPFCEIVGNAGEAEKAALTLYKTNKNAKTCLLGQTTISEVEYIQIADTIKKHFPDIKVINTICNAATDRRQALRELLTQVDAVIVAGGKDSSNTRRLLVMAQESGKPCALVENAAEIPAFFYTCDTVGISAGASTPDSFIEKIEMELMKHY